MSNALTSLLKLNARLWLAFLHRTAELYFLSHWGFHHAQLWLVQFRCGAVGWSQQPGKVLLISQLVPLVELPCWMALCVPVRAESFYLLCPGIEGVKSCWYRLQVLFVGQKKHWSTVKRLGPVLLGCWILRNCWYPEESWVISEVKFSFLFHYVDSKSVVFSLLKQLLLRSTSRLKAV